MTKYAIIQIKDAQYTVEEGKTYEVPKFQADENTKMDIKEVLAVCNNDKLELGKPFVGTGVQIEVLEQGKGEKIKTRLFRAKSRYKKLKGYRQRVTKFKVLKIA